MVGTLFWGSLRFLEKGDNMDYFMAFQLGYKPAIYDTVLSQRFVEVLPTLKEKYPYMNKGIGLREDTTTYMFFQNQKLKAGFEEQLDNVGHKSPEFHKILGLALGYPPKAVEFFARLQMKDEEAKKLQPKRVGMHYMGIPCNGNVDDLVENCLWLWDTYTVPEVPDTLKVRIETTFYDVQYKDIDTLVALQDKVNRILTAAM